MVLEPDKLEGSEGKSGLRSHPCPVPHLRSLAWGIFHYLQSSPAAGRSFSASWCLHSSQTLRSFVFLSLFFMPAPSSRSTPQLPTLPFSLCLSAVPLWPLALKGRHKYLFRELKFSFWPPLEAAASAGFQSRPDQAELPQRLDALGVSELGY